MVEGIVDTPYAIGNLAVDIRYVETPITVLWFRSVGNTHTAYVMETMLDELAHLAGKDPVALRLSLLTKQPRHAEVVRLAAEKSGWGQPVGEGQGRGFAFHHSFNTSVAMVADVSTKAAKLKVERIVAAVDCGVAIDPDVVTAQIEGAIGFALVNRAAKSADVQRRNGRAEQLRRLRTDAHAGDAESRSAHCEIHRETYRHRRAGRAASGSCDCQRHRREHRQAPAIAASRSERASVNLSSPWPLDRPFRLRVAKGSVERQLKRFHSLFVHALALSANSSRTLSSVLPELFST